MYRLRVTQDSLLLETYHWFHRLSVLMSQNNEIHDCLPTVDLLFHPQLSSCYQSVRRNNDCNLACTQAVGWSKKPEFVMRSPSWIRAARSGPGWGFTKRARGGGRGEGRKTPPPSPRSLCQPSTRPRHSPTNPTPVIWEHSRKVENTRPPLVFSTFPSCSQMPVVFYHSVIHDLGFFICYINLLLFCFLYLFFFSSFLFLLPE